MERDFEIEMAGVYAARQLVDLGMAVAAMAPGNGTKYIFNLAWVPADKGSDQPWKEAGTFEWERFTDAPKTLSFVIRDMGRGMIVPPQDVDPTYIRDKLLLPSSDCEVISEFLNRLRTEYLERVTA